jgi:hypothetical protein
VVGDAARSDNTARGRKRASCCSLERRCRADRGQSNRKAFDPIARYVVADSATWAQPAISGDRIFIKDVNTLAVVDDVVGPKASTVQAR